MKTKPLRFLILTILLGASVIAADARVLKSGDKGEDVRKWQLFLINRMFMQEPAYGNFAERTTQGTKRFQKQYGLKQTGLFDAATEKKARSLGFVPYAGQKNRLGKYAYMQSGTGYEREWMRHSFVELKPKGVAVFYSTGSGTHTGIYKMQGDEVLFNFANSKKYTFMGTSAIFQGETLFTQLEALTKDDDPGEYNPKFPDGYPYRKQ